MTQKYTYRKRVFRDSSYRTKKWLTAALLLALLIGGASWYIYQNTKQANKGSNSVTSGVQNEVISDNSIVYTSPYFKFADTGAKWAQVKNQQNSPNIFIYDKFNGQTLLGEMTFYINQEADQINGYTRVLPVRLVNDNSFEVTGVSDPCVSQYAPTEAKFPKVIKFNGALMKCNPTTGLYTVIVSEIGGDYHLHLKRSGGLPIQLEIIFSLNGLDPTVVNFRDIMNSFQVL